MRRTIWVGLWLLAGGRPRAQCLKTQMGLLLSLCRAEDTEALMTPRFDALLVGLNGGVT